MLHDIIDFLTQAMHSPAVSPLRVLRSLLQLTCRVIPISWSSWLQAFPACPLDIPISGGAMRTDPLCNDFDVADMILWLPACVIICIYGCHGREHH